MYRRASGYIGGNDEMCQAGTDYESISINHLLIGRYTLPGSQILILGFDVANNYWCSR